MRFHPSLPYRSDAGGWRRYPALVAVVAGDDGELQGVHRTWLDPRRPVERPRKALGRIHGFAVRFGEPAAACNRAYEILRAMLNTARQWGDLGDSVPDTCAHIVRNASKPVASYLNREELNRLGAALDRLEATDPWPVAAIRLLILTGGRLSEVVNLKWWDQIGEMSEDGSTARLSDSKTGPRTIWLGPDATRLIEQRWTPIVGQLGS